jgi:hypothetical protein
MGVLTLYYLACPGSIILASFRRHSATLPSGLRLERMVCSAGVSSVALEPNIFLI